MIWARRRLHSVPVHWYMWLSFWMSKEDSWVLPTWEAEEMEKDSRRAEDREQGGRG